MTDQLTDAPRAATHSPSPTRRDRVDPAAAEVLRRARVEGNLVQLPDEQLERKLYEAVNKVLASLGGKWNRRQKAHVFAPDVEIAAELSAVLDTGILKRTLHGFFETPRALGERLVALADVRPEHLVLEPSAGRGALSDLLAAIVPGDRLYQVELLASNHRVLIEKGYLAPRLILGDFLAVERLPRFDRVVMNPPFERRQDVRHVLRAYELLAPGGRIAAIMSAGTSFREDRLTAQLRALVESSPGGAIIDNPDGAFAESGTEVRTITVTLGKAIG
jgi:hypothetical protein